MTEKFDPSDSNYTNVESLPESERGNYVDSNDGFITKAAHEEDTRFEKEASGRKKEGWSSSGRYGGFVMTPEDIAHEEAYEINRVRERTAEDIENFDVNQDGLAIHGMPFTQSGGTGRKLYTEGERFKQILREGLKQTPGAGVDFNLLGAKGVDVYDAQRKEAVFGFGPNKIRFGGEIVFVTDVFKRLWPHKVARVLYASGNTTHVGEQLSVKIEKGEFGRGLMLQEKPSRGTSYHVEDTQQKMDEYDQAHPGEEAGDVNLDDTKNNQELQNTLLRHWAFNGLVITDEIMARDPDILKKVITVQDEVLPKQEQIPCYTESGECIYNPLKVGN